MKLGFTSPIEELDSLTAEYLCMIDMVVEQIKAEKMEEKLKK